MARTPIVPPKPFKQGALTPTTRKPRDGRASPIRRTDARSMPDAPNPKRVPVAPAIPGSVNTVRTSAVRGKKFGEY